MLIFVVAGVSMTDSVSTFYLFCLRGEQERKARREREEIS